MHATHNTVTSEEATRTFDTALQSEHLSKLNNLLDGLDTTTDKLQELQRREVKRGEEIKQEIHFKTQYLTSLLQSREKALCEKVDSAVNSNTSLINTSLERMSSTSKKLETFSTICQEFRAICTDNLLLQVKPLIEKRYEMLVRTCDIPHSAPCLDNVTWVDSNTEQLCQIVNSFGALSIDKRFNRWALLT